MELVDPTNWIPLSVLTVCLAAVVYFFGYRRRRYNLPPGPSPWPIIGNLNLIGPLPHCSIHALSQKYGPIMHLWLGSKPVVVGSSVEMAQAILKTHDATFVGRPMIAAGKYLTYNYSNITWAQYGPYLRQARKMFKTELFSPKRIESYEYIRKDEIKSMLKKIYESSNKTIVLKDHLFALSLNVISRIVLGKKYTDEESKNGVVSTEELMEMIDELFFLMGGMNIGDFIPWLDFLDLQGCIKRMKAVSKKFDRFLEHELEEHIERRKGVEDYEAKDMVDVLLQLADDPTNEVKIERHGVKAFILDLIAGGTDTTTITLEWAICELLRKPKIFEKATLELDRVIGRERWVEEQDISNLPFITAIVKETMRLHPTVPMLVPRLAIDNCKIVGYDIPKGTQVFVHVWAIGRDPTIWDNPNQFKPERFLEKTIDVKGQDFEFLPFGAGRRMCPGYPLGLRVIQVGLANLLHGFHWRLFENMKGEDLNMEESFGLTIPKKIPLETLVKPRLSPNLYY